MAAEDLPSEIHDRLSTFDDGLSKVEEIFNELHDVPIGDLHAKMTSLDKAKLDLIGAYAINSLFWMYLNAKGENPKDHSVKQELERIKSYMGRVKEIQDKEKAPKLNAVAAKRFVRSALWEQAHKKAYVQNEETSNTSMGEDGQMDTEIPTKKQRLSEKGGRKKKKKKDK